MPENDLGRELERRINSFWGRSFRSFYYEKSEREIVSRLLDGNFRDEVYGVFFETDYATLMEAEMRSPYLCLSIIDSGYKPLTPFIVLNGVRN